MIITKICKNGQRRCKAVKFFIVECLLIIKIVSNNVFDKEKMHVGPALHQSRLASCTKRQL